MYDDSMISVCPRVYIAFKVVGRFCALWVYPPAVDIGFMRTCL